MTYKANRATYDSDQLKAAASAAAQASHRQGLAELKATERALDERKKELSTLNAAYMTAHEKMLKAQREQRSRDQHMAGMCLPYCTVTSRITLQSMCCVYHIHS
jgi:hypothetical protein